MLQAAQIEPEAQFMHVCAFVYTEKLVVTYFQFEKLGREMKQFN